MHNFVIARGSSGKKAPAYVRNYLDKADVLSVYLHIRQAHSLNFHFLILQLNSLRDLEILIGSALAPRSWVPVKI